MDSFEYFCQLVGFSVMTILLCLGLVFLFLLFFDAVLRKLTDRIARRLIEIYGLAKVQAMYANRSYLTFVWKKREVQAESEEESYD